jgi:addiction module HigA family antidote
MPKTAVHPGEILREDFMLPLGLSARQLATEIGVPPNRISDIVREQRSLTADTAIRLGRYFGIDAVFWLNLQQMYDLAKARAENDYSGIRKRAA